MIENHVNHELINKIPFCLKKILKIILMTKKILTHIFPLTEVRLLKVFVYIPD